MTRSRHLLALAGVLLGCLALPTVSSAQTTDPSPTSAVASGPLASGPLTGQAIFRLSQAIDASGVASVWLNVDGQRVAETAQPCAADPFMACSNIYARVTFPVDLKSLPDGEHTFVVGVTDGDDYDSVALTRVLQVDNTAPGAPVPVTPLQTTTSASSLRLQWQAPPGDASVSIAKMTVCDAASCRNLVRPNGSVDLRLGVTKVSIVLRDAAGNSDPTKVTTWEITRVPAPRINPGLSITSASPAANRRTMTVTGRLAIPHTNHVSVSVRARFGRRTRTVRTIVATSGHDFRAQLVLPSARWRTATVIARVAGNSRYLTVEKRKQVRRPGVRAPKR
jgi:hypothetical protein